MEWQHQKKSIGILWHDISITKKLPNLNILKFTLHFFNNVNLKNNKKNINKINKILLFFFFKRLLFNYLQYMKCYNII